jgi:FAD binding domain.
MKYDTIVIGAGLAGLVVTTELAEAGKRILLLDQEPSNALGGQAWWSFGGLFFVNSPEQRLMGIKDSEELAWQDWLGAAGFDRLEDEDYWGIRWAEKYVEFAAGKKREWLRSLGIKFFPVVAWAERGGYLADGHGNSVPRFHITWGTGPGLVEPFVQRMKEGMKKGCVDYRPRHRVDELIVQGGAVIGVKGSVLAESNAARGEESSREVISDFEFVAPAVVIASGGIGGNFDLIRKQWPERLGKPPKHLLSGVPAHVDGRMLSIAERAGARLVNRDRMWHYTEGIKNWNPIWPHHGIRILPGPSSVWLDATGKRLPVPCLPGFDTLGTLKAILETGYEYSWFILNEKIAEKEFALSGSEQNPDLTERSLRQVMKRLLPGPPPPVKAFLDSGEDFLVADRLSDLIDAMNRLSGRSLLDLKEVERQMKARDREIENKFTKDLQIVAMRGARKYIGDKLVRVAKPHQILDPRNGPLIAVRLHILSRKTLGGLQTDLSGRVLDGNRKPIPGLFAAGEVSGFGGGGLHGYRSLEGTFLGGCLFSGLQVSGYLKKEL